MDAGVLLFIAIIYFIPVIVARLRGHRQSDAIALTNLFFGWTFIGWAIALIWAVKD